jgi:hypothetical protein
MSENVNIRRGKHSKKLYFLVPNLNAGDKTQCSEQCNRIIGKRKARNLEEGARHQTTYSSAIDGPGKGQHHSITCLFT